MNATLKQFKQALDDYLAENPSKEEYDDFMRECRDLLKAKGISHKEMDEYLKKKEH